MVFHIWAGSSHMGDQSNEFGLAHVVVDDVIDYNKQNHLYRAKDEQ